MEGHWAGDSRWMLVIKRNMCGRKIVRIRWLLHATKKMPHPLKPPSVEGHLQRVVSWRISRSPIANSQYLLVLRIIFLALLLFLALHGKQFF